MTKRNPYLQHTYESFDQPVPPKRPPQDPGFAERILGSDMLERVRSPLFATVALLLTGAAFAGIIIATYPDSDVPESNIPVITADASPLRETPSNPGGMAVAHEDSTIYNSIRSSGLQETPPIENLLAEEKPVETPADTLAALGTAGAPEETTASAVEPAAGELQSAPPLEVAETAPVSDPVSPSGEPTKTAETTVSADTAEARGIPMKSDSAASAMTAKPSIPPAASTPETLAYVRSVLENKDAPKDMAAAPIADSSAASSSEPLPAIEPASGVAAAAGAAIKPGSTYIQLASISSEAAAPKEWAKLQKAHSSLAGLEYRVQRADLGAKGVFYRIQAGPMSKDSAKGVCASVKASKPGGCIIVQ